MSWQEREIRLSVRGRESSEDQSRSILIENGRLRDALKWIQIVGFSRSQPGGIPIRVGKNNMSKAGIKDAKGCCAASREVTHQPPFVPVYKNTGGSTRLSIRSSETAKSKRPIRRQPSNIIPMKMIVADRLHVCVFAIMLACVSASYGTFPNQPSNSCLSIRHRI